MANFSSNDLNFLLPGAGKERSKDDETRQREIRSRQAQKDALSKSNPLSKRKAQRSSKQIVYRASSSSWARGKQLQDMLSFRQSYLDEGKRQQRKQQQDGERNQRLQQQRVTQQQQDLVEKQERFDEMHRKRKAQDNSKQNLLWYPYVRVFEKVIFFLLNLLTTSNLPSFFCVIPPSP